MKSKRKGGKQWEEEEMSWNGVRGREVGREEDEVGKIKDKKRSKEEEKDRDERGRGEARK